MSSGVRVELAAKTHREILERFPCCTDRRVFGSRRPRCTEPWSHAVQTYVRTQALSRTVSPAGRSADHRMLLVFDDDLLVAVAAHQRVDPLPDDPQVAREIDFVAVRTENRGVRLSDEALCSDTVLSELLRDAARREQRLTHVHGEVHRGNKPSLGLLRRHGALVAEPIDDVHRVLLPITPRTAEPSPPSAR